MRSQQFKIKKKYCLQYVFYRRNRHPLTTKSCCPKLSRSPWSFFNEPRWLERLKRLRAYFRARSTKSREWKPTAMVSAKYHQCETNIHKQAPEPRSSSNAWWQPKTITLVSSSEERSSLRNIVQTCCKVREEEVRSVYDTYRKQFNHARYHRRKYSTQSLQSL